MLYTVQLVDKNGDPVGNPGKQFDRRRFPTVNADMEDLTSVSRWLRVASAVVRDSATGVPTDSPGAVIFSTEDGVLNNTDINVKR